jgi:hypothetical protein
LTHVFFFSGVGLSPLGTAATSVLLYKPQMIDEGDCGAIGGVKIGRGNRSTRRKPALAPLCPPQIPHDFDSCLYLHKVLRFGFSEETENFSYNSYSLYIYVHIYIFIGGPFPGAKAAGS